MPNPIIAKAIRTAAIGIAGVAGNALFTAGAEAAVQKYHDAKAGDPNVIDGEVVEETPQTETKTKKNDK